MTLPVIKPCSLDHFGPFCKCDLRFVGDLDALWGRFGSRKVTCLSEKTDERPIIGGISYRSTSLGRSPDLSGAARPLGCQSVTTSRTAAIHPRSRCSPSVH